MILLSRLQKLQRLVWIIGLKFVRHKARDLEWITRDMMAMMQMRLMMTIPAMFQKEIHFRISWLRSNRARAISLTMST